MSRMGSWEKYQAISFVILLASGTALCGTELGNGGAEFGNGSFVYGSSNSDLQVPAIVDNWTTKESEAGVEFEDPKECSDCKVKTRFRITMLDSTTSGEEETQELEQLGWKRFNWADLSALRLEQRFMTGKRLLVRLLRGDTTIEYSATGSRNSDSFAALYNWLTPRPEEKK